MFLKDYGKNAIVAGDEAISYRELLRRVEACAEQYDIRPGDRVALFLENSPLWICLFYSVWRKGGLCVPVDYSLQPEELAFILNDCTPAVLFCTGKERETVSAALSRCAVPPRVIDAGIVSDAIGSFPPSAVFSIDPPRPGDTAVIMYTSGTTGAPKGVMLTYENLQASIQGVRDLKMLTGDDAIIALLPFYHIFPLQGSVLAPLALGSEIVFIPGLTKEEIFGTLQRHRVTMFLGVPRLYKLFHAGLMEQVRANPAAFLLFLVARVFRNQRLGRRLFDRIHRAFGGRVHSYLVGGAKLDPGVARDLWTLGFRLVEGYGATETAPLIAFNPGQRIKLGSVGLPMAGTEVKIEDGEVLVRGRNVMKGYWNKPEETARALRGGWFHTGDTGFFDRAGYLYLTGRKDEMIVLPNGKNVNPEEIEADIMSLALPIREIGVMENDGRLLALVYPNLAWDGVQGYREVFENIKREISERYNRTVAHYKKILKVLFVDEEFPKTRLGKVKRFMLHEAARSARKGAAPAAGDRPPETEAIRRFLKGLKRADAAPDAHLELDLGLDSLEVFMLLAFVERTFGVKLDAEDVSRHPTVDGFAHLVRKRGAPGAGPSADVSWREILSSGTARFDQRPTRLYKAIPLARRLFRRFFSFSSSGAGSLPPEPFIVAANHQSYLDIIAISISLPRPIMERSFFWVKASRFASRFIRLLSGGKSILLLDRARRLKHVLFASASILRSGRNLIVFPEGIRTRDGRMAPFKKTFAILSRELGVPIVPARIDGAYEALPYKSARLRRSVITVRYLPPVYPGDRSHEELAAAVEKAISACGQ
jgi:long-chain acyl-CoA synthetase